MYVTGVFTILYNCICALISVLEDDHIISYEGMLMFAFLKCFLVKSIYTLLQTLQEYLASSSILQVLFAKIHVTVCKCLYLSLCPLLFGTHGNIDVKKCRTEESNLYLIRSWTIQSSKVKIVCVSGKLPESSFCGLDSVALSTTEFPINIIDWNECKHFMIRWFYSCEAFINITFK